MKIYGSSIVHLVQGAAGHKHTYSVLILTSFRGNAIWLPLSECMFEQHSAAAKKYNCIFSTVPCLGIDELHELQQERIGTVPQSHGEHLCPMVMYLEEARS